MIDFSISKQTISASVSSEIKKLIMMKKLRPGDTLPSQKDLALQLGVGRPAVREAIKRLEAMGIVRVQHGKSTTIEKVDIDNVMLNVSPILELTDTDVLQLLEAKEIIETKCVELAAERATRIELEEMEKHLVDMDRYREDPHKHAVSDFLLHFTIVKSARNPIIIETMKLIGRMIEEAIEQTAIEDDLAGRDKARIYHRGIFNAIREKNGKKAVEILHKHSMESRRRYAASHSARSK
jgi:GntR family transcriptional repressor for pyruvate dehydrogenase complex